MTYYTIYKTTNQINGKFYIGAHKTKDLNDTYLGSGKLLKRAIEKYGVENFKREILFVFDTPEEMFAKEAELVTEEFLSENNTYNLKVGGFGGFDYINQMEDISKIRSGNGKRVIENLKGHVGDKEHCRRIGILGGAISKIKYPNGAFSGKTHSEETKKKISESATSRVGSLNSQYGKVWITDGISSKKMNKGEALPEGWCHGRKIN